MVRKFFLPCDTLLLKPSSETPNKNELDERKKKKDEDAMRNEINKQINELN